MWQRLWTLLDPLLFGAWSNTAGPLPRLVRLLRYPYALLRDLSRGDLNLRAMSLVFTSLLATIPLVAFSFAILKAFGIHRELEPIVLEFFRPLGRAGGELSARVMQFADSVSGGIVGSVGFALLLWTLLGTVEKVEGSLNFVWRVQQPRSFARRISEYLGLLIVGPLMLVGFLGLAHSALASEPMLALTELPLLDRIWAWLLQISPYLIVMTIFTALYMFIPNTKVHLVPALVGGVSAGVLWAAIGKLFTALVMFTSRLTIVYAGFALVVAALLWTYFGWLILLIGAQLSFYAQNRHYLRLGLSELRLSAVEYEDLSLTVMYLIGQAHRVGQQRWSVNTLAAALGLPGVAIAQVAAALERAQLLTATDDDTLLPARDTGQIRLQEILEVARNVRSGHLDPQGLSVAPVTRLSARLAASLRESCGERTLGDLIDEPA